MLFHVEVMRSPNSKRSSRMSHRPRLFENCYRLRQCPAGYVLSIKGCGEKTARKEYSPVFLQAMLVVTVWMQRRWIVNIREP
ncbi:hypothetical protein HZ326_8762 [Fusarium oxysporum f. sp. albedinis]|nr:hypothetical protein HZ326_8762 [Fusarium oxysporum f. sp. albedinis]